MYWSWPLYQTSCHWCEVVCFQSIVDTALSLDLCPEFNNLGLPNLDFWGIEALFRSWQNLGDEANVMNETGTLVQLVHIITVIAVGNYSDYSGSSLISPEHTELMGLNGNSWWVLICHLCSWKQRKTEVHHHAIIHDIRICSRSPLDLIASSLFELEPRKFHCIKLP